MLEPIIMFVCGLALFVGFYFFDRWHERRAWRRANEEAHEMLQQYIMPSCGCIFCDMHLKPDADGFHRSKRHPPVKCIRQP